ncbi:MAG TPA: hypothetical protein PKL44_00200 [Candidatus Dojkabacteria bacterium]|nr:hypothetical protein [Candidatus Dojkabacteria bacterium]
MPEETRVTAQDVLRLIEEEEKAQRDFFEEAKRLGDYQKTEQVMISLLDLIELKEITNKILKGE